jgi:hypothetical protein
LGSKSKRRAIVAALNDLHPDLDSAYDDALKRIKGEEKQLAYRVLSWVTLAIRPITPIELQYAVAIEEGMTAIHGDDLDDQLFLTSICAGLVVVERNTVELVRKPSSRLRLAFNSPLL